MPRYRFAWSNFADRLLKKLAATQSLEGDPAAALARRYGHRPRPDFVQETWPTLLNEWLPSNASSRQFMVEELTAAGLGNRNISTRSKRGELEYLASCRNAPNLRNIALAAFLNAGEGATMDTPPRRGTSAVPRERVAPVQELPTNETGRIHPDRPDEQSDEVASLDDWVDDVLKQAFNLPEIHRDNDGDIPIPRGSAALFIRPHVDGSPFLEIFAPILQGFQLTSEVYEAINAINTQIPMAKLTIEGDGTLILMQAQLLTETLSPQELLFSIDVVGAAADHFDSLLQKRFGGTTWQEDDDDAIAV